MRRRGAARGRSEFDAIFENAGVKLPVLIHVEEPSAFSIVGNYTEAGRLKEFSGGRGAGEVSASRR